MIKTRQIQFSGAHIYSKDIILCLSVKYTSSIKNILKKCFFVCLFLWQYWEGFPGGSVVKNSPAKQEMWIQSLGWEDPLKKEMAIHSSIACEIPRTKKPGRLSPWGCERVGHDLVTKTTIVRKEHATLVVLYLISSPWISLGHECLQ